ncbi:MAG TPA: type II toxin-antitoxin system VapC family toxin, partial [Allosphingosinicella sp.]|nr:type II toxin-antitoxin system VapC family toxin [Allosphingosinicella sp.]
AVSKELWTRTAQDWLDEAEEVLVSEWLMTEAAAALSQKQRMNVMSAAERAEAMGVLRGQAEGAMQFVPVTREDFRTAARYAERAETGLRAGDALHLAIAAAADATLVTFDRKQARAAESLGVRILLLA